MEYQVSCFAMAGERQLPLFTAHRNLEMPAKRLLPFPMLQSLQPPVQQSQPSRSTGTTLSAHRLCKGEHNLHQSTRQQGPQVIQTQKWCLSFAGHRLEWQKTRESRGQQDLPKPLVTSACWEQGPVASRNSCRLYVTLNAHFCAQRAGDIPDAWARMPGGTKDEGE